MQVSIFKKECSESLSLSLPLITALLAQMAMELVNTIMLGRLGATELAAAGLAMTIFFTLLVLNNGIFSATGVLIARSYGAGNSAEIQELLTQSIYLAILLSIPTVVILRSVPYFLQYIGEPAELIALVIPFVDALSWGFPPLIFYLPLREYVAALSHTRIIMILSLIIAPIAGILNYILIYGKLGFPSLGIAGVGYSTAIVEWFLLGTMLLFIFKHKTLKSNFKFHCGQKLQWRKITQIIRLGLPVSVTMGLETGLFTVTTILMGFFGATTLAAHQIALQCATVAFMLPLGISQATAIRVGQTLGAGSVIKAKYACYAGLLCGVLFALMTAVFFTLFPEFIINLFIDSETTNSNVIIPTAVSFILVMALFQLVDAIQVIMNGALRGLKDTFVPMWLGLLSYWISGLLSGYCLAFVLKLGGIGLWWGLGIGIGVSSILLYVRFLFRIKQEETKFVAS